MKALKFITTGMLALFAATTLSAQEEGDNSKDMSPSFGIKGGVNFATVVNGDEDFNSPDSRTSFHVGVVGEFPIADIFSIQAEALYSGQGFKISDGGLLSDQDTEYQLDYINVPVLAKFYLFKGFSVEAGPQFSFKVNEEFDTEPTHDDGDTPVDEAKDFEFGVAGGVTFQTDMGLFASARYNRGFTDIYEDADLQNSVFQISLGYKF